MKITACLITRDERPFLGQSVPAVLQLADELIVVDSGSNDGTLSYLSTRATKIVQVPPRTLVDKGFAYLRNLADKHATGDWIYHVDADEMLSAEQRPQVRPLLAARKEVGVSLKVLTFFPSRANPEDWTWIANNCPHDPGRHVRMYRNGMGIEWRGYIHEELWYDQTRLFSIAFNSDLKHLHYTNYRKWAVPMDKERRAAYMMVKAYNNKELGQHMSPWWFQHWYPKHLKKNIELAAEYERDKDRIDPA